MSSDDDPIQLLQTAAHDGQLDCSKWPQLLHTVISRLNDIVKTTFPLPILPIAAPSSDPSQFSQLTPQASSSIDHSSTSPSRIPSSQQTELAISSVNHQSSAPQTDKALPASLQSFFDSIKRNLTTIFAEKPPYTIQRLAELLLVPDKHYKTLPAFLRAVDRVVSVSSTADIFPLPSIAIDTNGVLGSGPDDFNGAALTRIPWLREDSTDWAENGVDMVGIEERRSGPDLRTESTALIDGPNGAGSVETVTVTMNGIGRNGDKIDGGHAAKDTNVSSKDDETLPDHDDSAGNPDEAVEDVPHARGPEEIGMADMGPQATTLSIEPGPAESVEAAERAVGRPGEAERVAVDGDDGKPLADTEPTPMTEDKKD